VNDTSTAPETDVPLRDYLIMLLDSQRAHLLAVQAERDKAIDRPTAPRRDR